MARTGVTKPHIISGLERIGPGTVIPRPGGSNQFIVKGRGRRCGEEALVYFIPNRGRPESPYEKAITLSEFSVAYEGLKHAGAFTKQWFAANMHRCAEEGSCNFTMIGGIFCLLGLAAYEKRGRYALTAGS